MSKEQTMDELDLQILREFQKLTESQKREFLASIPSILAQSSTRPEEHISSPYSHNS
ncbi:MAG: hypothetical protein IJQ42_04600 [Oscillospiraceae bacterium]|nr:hypothetical protein [Oscillospiraceae bacterium]